MKTSKLVTEITNTRGIIRRLKPEFAHNLEHFPPFYCQKMDCSGLRYLSYESVKYSFDITLLKCALSFLRISKIQFRYYFTEMEGSS